MIYLILFAIGMFYIGYWVGREDFTRAVITIPFTAGPLFIYLTEQGVI